MDPMSAIAIAGTAFNAIKAGFEHGREIEAMAGAMGRWMGAIKDVKDGAQKKKKILRVIDYCRPLCYCKEQYK